MALIFHEALYELMKIYILKNFTKSFSISYIFTPILINFDATDGLLLLFAYLIFVIRSAIKTFVGVIFEF